MVTEVVDFGLPADKKPDDVSVNECGHIDQETLECIVVGQMIYDPAVDGPTQPTARIERVIESGTKREWFETKACGNMFQASIDIWRGTRSMPTKDSYTELALARTGCTQDEAAGYGTFAHKCLGAAQSWQIPTDLLMDRFVNRHLKKTADQLYQKFTKDFASPDVGPSDAIRNFQSRIMMSLSDPRGALLKENDWVSDYSVAMDRLWDMKLHPEKYAGFKCGIGAIDQKIEGFRPGHLTVFVGTHGGFKSTLLINIAYGLFLNGYNVIYVSLEMEALLLMFKLWSRATKKVSFSRLYQGHMTAPEDWKKVAEITEKLAQDGLDQKVREELQSQRERLQWGIGQSKEENEADTILIDKCQAEMSNRKNQLKILSAGQSKKIKASQLERFLNERRNKLAPQVVIVDYLTLVESDVRRPDGRNDLELGDVCKHLRGMGESMGFSVLTAAQFKRAAIDRLRKYGLEQIDKAAFGTDDIEGSNQIGADADNIIMLWREDGGNRVRALYPKLRYGQSDVAKGISMEVAPDICFIGGDGDIESTKLKAAQKTEKDIYASAAKIDSPKPIGKSMPNEEDEEVDVFSCTPNKEDEGFGGSFVDDI